MKTRLHLAFAVAIVASCSSDPSTGTGSQTGNAVMAGRILSTDGTKVEGTVVTIRPLNWTPTQSAKANAIQTTLADTAGAYVFVNVPLDTYRIEAIKEHRGWSRTIRATRDSAKVPSGTLGHLGRLLCEVEMNDTVAGGVVELYGLNKFWQLPATYTPGQELKHLFDSLPPGLHTVRIWSPSRKAVISDLPVRIRPDSMAKVEYEQWGHDALGPREDD